MSAFPPGEQGGIRSEAFPKSYRLTKTDDFSSVFSFRRTIRSTGFLLHYRPRADQSLDVARLGVVVAKRFLRRAVDRNLVRRLVREIFRKQHGDMPACDVIVRLAIKPPLPLDRDVLTTEVRSLLERLRTVGRRP